MKKCFLYTIIISVLFFSCSSAQTPDAEIDDFKAKVKDIASLGVLKDIKEKRDEFTLPDRDNNLDTDGDGIPNVSDDYPADPTNTPPVDTDGDGLIDPDDPYPNDPDNIPVDTDGDGMLDEFDPWPSDPTNTPIDSDGDRIFDRIDEYPDDPLNNDNDHDGIPNNEDPYPNGEDKVDTDFDGIPDMIDPYPNGEDRVDSDLDGIPDIEDEWPNGEDRPDRDNDGIPDIEDPYPDGEDEVDTDNDNIPDIEDPYPNGEDKVDTDGDGIHDGDDNIDDRDPMQKLTEKVGHGFNTTISPRYTEGEYEYHDFDYTYLVISGTDHNRIKIFATYYGPEGQTRVEAHYEQSTRNSRYVDYNGRSLAIFNMPGMPLDFSINVVDFTSISVVESSDIVLEYRPNLDDSVIFKYFYSNDTNSYGGIPIKMDRYEIWENGVKVEG